MVSVKGAILRIIAYLLYWLLLIIGFHLYGNNVFLNRLCIDIGFLNFWEQSWRLSIYFAVASFQLKNEKTNMCIYCMYMHTQCGLNICFLRQVLVVQICSLCRETDTQDVRWTLSSPDRLREQTVSGFLQTTLHYLNSVNNQNIYKS